MGWSFINLSNSGHSTILFFDSVYFGEDCWCSLSVLVHEGSPLGELHRCVRDGIRINVHIRTFKGLRGVCTGFLVAFDKFWNMVIIVPALDLELLHWKLDICNRFKQVLSFRLKWYLVLDWCIWEVPNHLREVLGERESLKCSQHLQRFCIPQEGGIWGIPETSRAFSAKPNISIMVGASLFSLTEITQLPVTEAFPCFLPCEDFKDSRWKSSY